MLLINSWRDFYLWNVWIETSTGDDNVLELNLAYSSAIILLSWNKKKSVTLQPVTHNGMKTSWTLRAWRPCRAAISNFSRFFSFKLQWPGGPVRIQLRPEYSYRYCKSTNGTIQRIVLSLEVAKVSRGEWFPGEVTWQTQSSSCELSSILAKNTASKAVMLTSDLLVFWSMGHISSFKTSASLAPLIPFAMDSSSRSSCPLTENAPWSILHIIPSEYFSWSVEFWAMWRYSCGCDVDDVLPEITRPSGVLPFPSLATVGSEGEGCC